jgi:mannosyltransferase OCH1-like enzyme
LTTAAAFGSNDAAGNPMIPRIIHQSWKVEQVPDRWLGFQQSWRKNHPDYEYRFWTDEANRAFVAQTFPELLPVYDGYRHPISRADLARYLVVCHFGGIYADLDCEALKPLDDLIAGHELIFGLEPPSHVNNPELSSRGLTRVVCNAIFAAVPRHPFWQHLFPMLIASRGESNVLEAAGPYVLTRACDSYRHPEQMTILPSDVLYPLDRLVQPKPSDVESIKGAYTVHHWAGSWLRDALISNARHRILAARGASGSGEAR